MEESMEESEEAAEPSAESSDLQQNDTSEAELPDNGGIDLTGIPEIPGLKVISRMAPDYAVTFDIYYYENDYSLIDVFGDAQYLLVPDNAIVPEGLPDGIKVIRRPLQNVYLVATAAYSLIESCGGLDAIRFSGTDEDGISLESVQKRMEEGLLTFAGRYSAPDYEMLVKHNCDLAIQSTRIYHTPEIIEMLEELGIPVFVDRSSYETHPLGRTEWIRVYGELLGKQAEADAYFEEQEKGIEELSQYPGTGKEVVFFYMNSDGTAVIRRPEDYMVKMIEIAGGVYSFKDFKTDSALTSISVGMEEFYSVAKDADYIIYNASVNSPITSIQDLLDMSPLFEDFKAVTEDQVWTTDKSVYQSAHITSEFTKDLHELLTDQDESVMQFLHHVH